MEEAYCECLDCKKKFGEEKITISGDKKRCPDPDCKSDKIVKWRHINSGNTESWIGRALWKKEKYPKLHREYSK